MSVMSMVTGLSLRTWLITGAVVLAVAAGGGFIAYQRYDAVRDEREAVKAKDEQTATGVDNAVSNATRDIDDGDPDGLLRETGGLRDD